MGGNNSTPTASASEVELDHQDIEDGGLQDEHFPWFHIVQWCSEDLNSSFVWRWDIKVVKQRIEKLTISEENFLAECGNNDTLEEDFSLDQQTFFLEWAMALLEQIESLKEVRFKLVPGRMKEDVFWKRYFAGIKRVVVKEFFLEAEEVKPQI